jgi:hypothetical protein
MGFNRAFVEELVKLSAIDRSILKDFAAGVDPTGTRTLEYGMQDAGERGSGLRRAAGTVGGLIGGATVVPAGVSALIEGAKGLASGGVRGGLKGFATGTYKPFTQLYRAIRGTGTLGKMQAGSNLSKGEIGSLRALVAERSPSLTPHVRAITGDDAALRALIARSQQKLTSAQLASEPAVARALSKHLEGSLHGAATQAGEPVRRVGEAVSGAARATGSAGVGRVADKASDLAGSIRAEMGNLVGSASRGVSEAAEKAVQEGGKHFRGQLSSLSSTPEGLAKIRQGLLDTARREGMFDMARGSLKDVATQIGAGLGLSAGIAGGSAYLQYGKGQGVGRRMQQQRQQLLQQQQGRPMPRPMPRPVPQPASRILKKPTIPPRRVKPMGAPNALR